MALPRGAHEPNKINGLEKGLGKSSSIVCQEVLATFPKLFFDNALRESARRRRSTKSKPSPISATGSQHGGVRDPNRDHGDHGTEGAIDLLAEGVAVYDGRQRIGGFVEHGRGKVEAWVRMRDGDRRLGIFRTR